MRTHYAGRMDGTWKLGGILGLGLIMLAPLSHGQGGGIENPSECGLNMAIPDDGCGTLDELQVLINVDGNNNELGSNVALTHVELIVSHTWNSDLRVYLMSPNGAERTLIMNRGGFGEGFGESGDCPESTLTLHDGGLSLATMVGNNITGQFAPEDELAGFTGDPNGLWTLRICDSESDDVGSLQYVALVFDNTFVSVEELTTLQSMELWPNPVNDQLNMSLNSLVSGTLEYSVFDALGRQVNTGSRAMNAGGHLFNMDMGSLPAGHYSMRFVLNGSVHVHRFVKQ